MPAIDVNGIEIFAEESGSGAPVVFVHGSWTDGTAWTRVRALLEDTYRTVAYDRRGHSRSAHVEGQGSIHEDVEDLAGLVRALDLAPVHLVGNSGGAIVSLRAAAAHPELFRSLAVHEPPLFTYFRDDPQVSAMIAAQAEKLGAVYELIAAGDNEEAARRFVTTLIAGPEYWNDVLDEATRQRYIRNAPTFLDEHLDPDFNSFDPPPLKAFERPVLLSYGSASPPTFQNVARILAEAAPAARLEVVEGAGHSPHNSHPEPYAAMLRSFFAEAD